MKDTIKIAITKNGEKIEINVDVDSDFFVGAFQSALAELKNNNEYMVKKFIKRELINLSFGNNLEKEAYFRERIGKITFKDIS